MDKTSNDSNKYAMWCVTINATDEDILLDRNELETFLNANCEEYVFQIEKESRRHWQGVMKLELRTRKATLLNKMEGAFPNEDIRNITLQRCIDYTKSKIYCSDSFKRLTGTEVLMYPAEYSESDITFLDDPNNRHRWQNTLLFVLFGRDETVFKKPDDRTVYWITDTYGNSGKSKFIKWLYCRYKGVTKLSFGTSTQLRAALCSEGPRLCYFIDFPRTLGSEDSLNTVLSVIEDLKNGFVRSAMYGDNKVLLMEPPHIVCLSNNHPPIEKLSKDRWVEFRMNNAFDFVTTVE